MAFAGGLGAQLKLDDVSLAHSEEGNQATILLFSESNTRFICEVAEQHVSQFEAELQGVPFANIGTVSDTPNLEINFAGNTILSGSVSQFKQAWQAPLDW